MVVKLNLKLLLGRSEYDVTMYGIKIKIFSLVFILRVVGRLVCEAQIRGPSYRPSVRGGV